VQVSYARLLVDRPVARHTSVRRRSSQRPSCRRTRASAQCLTRGPFLSARSGYGSRPCATVVGAQRCLRRGPRTMNRPAAAKQGARPAIVGGLGRAGGREIRVFFACALGWWRQRPKLRSSPIRRGGPPWRVRPLRCLRAPMKCCSPAMARLRRSLQPSPFSPAIASSASLRLRCRPAGGFLGPCPADPSQRRRGILPRQSR
jgi:hypothetical protein